MSELEFIDASSTEKTVTHIHEHKGMVWGFFCGFMSGVLMALIISVAILIGEVS